MLDNASARQALSRIVTPVAKSLIALRVTADAVTCCAALATIGVATLLVPQGKFLIASILIGALSLGDLLDGTIARLTNSAGKWGAFLDSTLDRIVDAAVLISICTYFLTSTGQNKSAFIAASISLLMGQMTSYIRARAEALGKTCKVGLAERAERTLVVWFGLLISGLGLFCLDYAMYFLAAITSYTVIQRVVHVRKQIQS